MHHGHSLFPCLSLSCSSVPSCYSKYGHIRTMANAVKHGIESAGGEATLFKVPEIQSAEVLQAEPDHEV